MKRAALLGLCLSMLPTVALAGDLGVELPSEAGRNAASVRVGVDDALVTMGLGYTRGIALPRIRRSLMVGGSFAMPMTRPDFGDFEVGANVRMDAVRARGFALPVAQGVSLVRTGNELFDGVGLMTWTATYPGYYRPRWFAATEVRWDQTWASHLRHRAPYDTVIYPGAVDGWYAVPTWAMRYGLRAGGLVHPRVELMLRGGYQQTPGLDPLSPPLYVDLTMAVRF
ncbi:MAG: hypothetical protein KUG77_27500 [Nannocystaceae bacterium]|nr:hypothetical protein [Nannocystaceae bacterium]